VLYYYIVIFRYILLIVRKKIKKIFTKRQAETACEVLKCSMSFEFIDLNKFFVKIITEGFITALFIIPEDK
jgi:hypothetical protein